MRIAKYVLVRILIWALTIWVGVTAVFILPRLMPADPIEGMIGRLNSKGSQMTAEQIESMRSALRRQFGLEGTVMEQYATSMKRMLSFDFGPSFTLFPTPVTDLIRQYLPYTVGLMLITSLISFVFGNLIGLLAGFKKNRWYSKFLETAAMCIYPIPYFILALILLILCCSLNNWFPLVASMPAKFSLTWDWVSKIVYNSFLPALSLIILGGGWWIISMKSLASNTAEEEYVNYGRLKGLKERTIAYRYVYKNSILTQITTLSLQLGGMFGGALMTEIMFGYPGVGALTQSAILQADYNLMLGLITLSIVAVSTATLLVDLLYPFLDPRVRYK